MFARELVVGNELITMHIYLANVCGAVGAAVVGRWMG